MAKRAGLGRGLDALLGETVGEVRHSSDAPGLRELRIEDVQPNPDQPRRSFDEDELAELADSVARCGVLQPIVVRPFGGSYQIVAGERRYQAAKRAGLATVPVVVREVSDEEMLQLALVENLQRSDLNPMEAARGYRDLAAQNGLTHAEVAEILSKSRSAISNAIRLLDLPEEVQGYVEDGLLSAGHARAILAVADDEGKCALAQKVIRDGLTVRQTETLAPLFFVKDESHREPRAATPQSYKVAARRLGEALGTKVRVRTVRGTNKVEIEFSDEEDLEELVARVMGGAS
ncbi:MAG: ParB/RepB/Spo0J family partition protein [Atopobiaceae bacterium]|nr:ParB/RepB/Spo0J family partition protein [Atopobiaceae bacterium]